MRFLLITIHPVCLGEISVAPAALQIAESSEVGCTFQHKIDSTVISVRN